MTSSRKTGPAKPNPDTPTDEQLLMAGVLDLDTQVLGAGQKSADDISGPQLSIHYVNQGGEGTTVKLDGIDVAGACQGISIRLDQGQRPYIVLDIAALEVDVDMMSNQPVIFLPEKTRELLVRLGWTPPAGEWGTNG